MAKKIRFSQFSFLLSRSELTKQIMFSKSSIYQACMPDHVIESFINLLRDDIINHGDDPNFPFDKPTSKLLLFILDKDSPQDIPADFAELLFELLHIALNRSQSVQKIHDIVFKYAVPHFKKSHPGSWCFDENEPDDLTESPVVVVKNIVLTDDGRRIFIKSDDIFAAAGIASTEINKIHQNYLVWLNQSNLTNKNFGIWKSDYVNRTDFRRILDFLLSYRPRDEDRITKIFYEVETRAIPAYQNMCPHLTW